MDFITTHFNDYQSIAASTDIATPAINSYVDSLNIPDAEKATNLKKLLGIAYMVLGLVGEAGELANKTKKIIRDSKGEITPEVLGTLAKENGDVTWYNSGLFGKLGVTFEAGANDNLSNLLGRKQRGTLTGSGDNR
jgi:NTP pyrophosphatase (non-canonical NTP hydrolase)